MPNTKVYEPNRQVANRYFRMLQDLESPFRTIRERARVVDALLNYLEPQELPLSEISNETLEEFTKEIMNNRSARTIKQQLALLKSFLKWCYEKDEISTHPDKLFSTEFKKRLPKAKKPIPTVASQNYIKKLLENCPEKWKAMLYLFYDSMCRVSELISIQINDIDFETRKLKIIQHKTNSERSVNLTEKTTRLIEDYIKLYRPTPKPGATEFLFISSHGNQMTSRNIQRWMKTWTKKYGKIISPKWFRASAATHMLENGADMRQVQMIGGWENPSTLQHYLAVSSKEKMKVKTKTHPAHMREAERKKTLEQKAAIEEMQSIAPKFLKLLEVLQPES
ncbi:MAG: tyrosine-type recombinase/integrase [Candidatus Heimdallarchaeota archaeon]